MAKARAPQRKRRYDGEGTVYASGDHGWCAELYTGGKRYRQRAATKEDAYRKLEGMRHRAGLGLPPPSADQLRVFSRWWLDGLEADAQNGDISTNTVDNARWAVEKWIIPELGTKRLRELETEDVERMLRVMADADLARSSLVRVRSILGQVLDEALGRDKVVRNVVRRAKIPATKPLAPRRSLTAEQADALLEAVRGDRLEALYVTGLMLGLRPGELTGLRWDDLEDGILYIEGSLKQQRSGPPGSGRTLVLGDTKTRKSRRPLRVPPPVTEALRAHRSRQKKERVLAGPEWTEQGLIFTTPIGTPLDPSNLRGSFSKITEAAGLGHWTLNELRHSAASLMSAQGVPLEVIADVLGHTNTRMLEQHYRHRTRPVIDAHVAVMNELFGTGAKG
jgi:integrase